MSTIGHQLWYPKPRSDFGSRREKIDMGPRSTNRKNTEVKSKHFTLIIVDGVSQ